MFSPLLPLPGRGGRKLYPPPPRLENIWTRQVRLKCWSWIQWLAKQFYLPRCKIRSELEEPIDCCCFNMKFEPFYLHRFVSDFEIYLEARLCKKLYFSTSSKVKVVSAASRTGGAHFNFLCLLLDLLEGAPWHFTERTVVALLTIALAVTEKWGWLVFQSSIQSSEKSMEWKSIGKSVLPVSWRLMLGVK